MSNLSSAYGKVLAAGANVAFSTPMNTRAARTEIVFIAADVSDPDVLLAGQPDGSEIVWLDADGDGVLQMAAVLGGRSGLDSIHVVSHGRAGALSLGTATLSLGTLDSYRGELATIRHALRAGGDILLYGCNVAAGSEGTGLVNALADATGADVAASTNATGSAALGGDWTLEAASGPIESAGFAAETVLPAYPGLLADDYPDDPSTPGRVAVGGSATGDIETTGDRDWFAVELVAGSRYVINLEGSPTSQGTLSDTYFDGVYDSSDVQHPIPGTTDDDSGVGYNSMIQFLPSVTGTYYLSARGYSGVGTGTYRLSLAEWLPPSGTPGPDVLNGSGSNDLLDGLAGDDTLNGMAGDDTLYGGANNDDLNGGSGDDLLDGGAGVDTVSYSDVYFAGVQINLQLGTASGGGGEDTLVSIENVIGGDGQDTLIGNDDDNRLVGGFGDDFLSGLGGNDMLYGYFGRDTLDGGAGDDVLHGGTDDFSSEIDTVSYASAAAGVTVSLALNGPQDTGGAGIDSLFSIENLTGSTFDDTLTGSGANNVIVGGAGDDLMDGGDGNDSVDYSAATSAVTVSLALGGVQATGGAGNDVLSNFETLIGSAFDDFLTGSNEANVLDGGFGNDTLFGGGANDTLVGGGGDDSLSAGEGDDQLDGGSGNNTLDGGSGSDSVSYASVAVGISIDLDAGTVILPGGVDSLVSVENVTGGYSNDILTGNASDNRFAAGDGDDRLAGLAGDDTLDGGAGTDTADYSAAPAGVTVNLALSGPQATGGAGADVLVSIERLLGSSFGDSLTGGSGTDTIDGGGGDDTLDGGAGIDWLSYAPSPGGVSVNLGISGPQNTVGAGTDSLSGFENLEGSEVDDTLTGAAAANKIRGGSGNDSLDGGLGDDTLVGGLGDDVLNGGEGRDEVSYQEVGSGPVRVDLGSLLPQDVGDQGFDTLLSIEVLRGTIYGDTLLGGAADESLYGGDGRDSLSGGAGHDLLSGGAYSDTLSGGLGNDSLIGGGPLVYWSGIDYVPAAGTDGDSLAGGLGDDTYEVTASSTEQYYSYAFGGTSGYGLQRGGTYAPDQGQEQPGEGIDTVQSYVSYVLPDNVENLQLMERSFDINGTGNALDNILTGNREANILDGGAGNDTMIGGAGEDTASYITAMSGVSVSLAIAGAQATGGSGSDTLISIENLIGSNFNDKLTGNSGANRLEGYAGNDTLDGGTGNDTMLGGDGNDYYYVRDSGDSVTETNATASIGGTDLVYSYLASYTLGANVENGRIVTSAAANLIGSSLNNFLYAGAGNNVIDGGAGSDTVSYYYGVSGTTGVTVSLATTAAQATGGSGTDTLTAIEHLRGSNHADKLTGNSGANRLEGYAGNDTLDGGSGNDTMLGGDGNDYYYVRDSGDMVSESNATASTGGTDLVYSYLSSYTLGANVENGRIVTSAAANLSGNALNNVLYAGAGNNVIDGGAGSDTVSYYYGVSGTTGVTVSLATTAAQATGGSGTDTLTAIEHLRGSNNADKLTGNSGANRLEGYAGNDTLDGGTGNDTMLGGDGNDYYYVRDSGDVVTETNATASTGGTDTVLSYLSSYTLGANVENGRIVTSAAANLSGNSLNNYLYAGAGDNVIDGGAGSDTVTYYYGVSGTTGVIVSLATTAAQATGGSGTDTLTSIEHLRGSNNADQLTGNSGANRLEGYAGNDTLNGGLGNDTLIGGSGSDSIRFDTLLNALSNRDTISDFDVAADSIELENVIFTSLNSTGTLAAGSFRSAAGVSAVDANDFILYDNVSGALHYDADGNGAGAAVQFASLSSGLALTNADFLVT
ncbi:MAG: DUF4347 domain-containing protein [Candidatus Accumulibacter delftensis]|jgi:Ca2+-binding RTX toxin-like protein